MCAQYCEQGHVARDAQLMVHRLLANITRCFFWLGCVLYITPCASPDLCCSAPFELALLLQSVFMILAQVRARFPIPP